MPKCAGFVLTSNDRIKLKDVNTQLGATLNKFVTEYDIKDVLIKEPEISEIVYNIYEGKVELKK